MAWDLYAFQLTPPKNIVHKQRLPLKEMDFIRTKEGITYLISSDGRYVFQGALFDVWNGEQIESMPEMAHFSDRIDFRYLGVKPDKMFTLTFGSGSKEVFVFADPNCSVCHQLLQVMMNSDRITSEFLVRVAVVTVLGNNSLEKAKKLVLQSRGDEKAALSTFIKNTYEQKDVPEEGLDKLQYNRILARALSIRSVPYIVNPQGVSVSGMPGDLYAFLLKE
jgi:thiol:disulfide interchange protein DsbC